MTQSEPTDPETGSAPADKPADARKTRGIRFSESEWKEVKTAAERHDVPAAEFVRERILEIARGRKSADGAAIPASLAPLIERTFRYTYMLATLRRDDMLRDGRGEEMEKLIETARQLQGRLQEEEPADGGIGPNNAAGDA